MDPLRGRPLTTEHLRSLWRHGGLVPVVTPGGAFPAPPDDGVVNVPLIWPAAAAPLQPRGDDVIERSASFELSADPRDLSLVLDWVVHVWLFVARYELAVPWVRVDPAGTRVDVPVCRNITRG